MEFGSRRHEDRLKISRTVLYRAPGFAHRLRVSSPIPDYVVGQTVTVLRYAGHEDGPYYVLDGDDDAPPAVLETGVVAGERVASLVPVVVASGLEWLWWRNVIVDADIDDSDIDDSDNDDADEVDAVADEDFEGC